MIYIKRFVFIPSKLDIQFYELVVLYKNVLNFFCFFNLFIINISIYFLIIFFIHII